MKESRRRAASAAPSERPEGAAAAAIADAEAALAQQNSASSQLDLQVISAILNAHLRALEGKEALDRLQQETEAAVRTRSDLDTPAGARDFQRFLIGKLRDIREVVANVSLDDTSKSALMAAWTSLYTASKGEPSAPGNRPPVSAAPAGSAGEAGLASATLPDGGEDPFFDPLLFDDPGPLLEGSARQGAAPSELPVAPPSLPSIPSFGGGGLPGLGTGSGWSAPGGLPLSGLRREGEAGLDPTELDNLTDESKDIDKDPHDKGDEATDASSEKPDPPPTGPTTVTLPDGETVTAASPQLAAVIKAAAGGMPIMDAFQQQGMTIPAPGTAVTHPIEPTQVKPGDIGIFNDRHALALGHNEALLDGQIQRISTVSGPSFLGWVHPPTPVTASAPANPEPPTRTRPAAR